MLHFTELLFAYEMKSREKKSGQRTKDPPVAYWKRITGVYQVSCTSYQYTVGMIRKVGRKVRKKRVTGAGFKNSVVNCFKGM